jgi:hypothetical protein
MLVFDPTYQTYLGVLREAASAGRFTLGPAFAVALLLLSLTYCYIASAPISVIHVTRMIREPFYSRWARYVWHAVWLLLGLCLAFQVAGTLAYHRKPDLSSYLALILAIPAGWMLIMQWLSVLRLHADAVRPRADDVITDEGSTGRWIGKAYEWFCKRVAAYPEKLNADQTLAGGQGRLEEFYFRLARNRSEPGRGDIRESYTHLREHSNSVFIVLFEISLASLIILALRCSPEEWTARALVCVALMFMWLLPNVFLWSQAHRLEAAVASGRY